MGSNYIMWSEISTDIIFIMMDIDRRRKFFAHSAAGRFAYSLRTLRLSFNRRESKGYAKNAESS